MARYGKEHKEATRQRIIEAAGRRLKRDGIDGSGVSTLMADAGLTNGAFYAHFESKDDLVATAVADQLHRQLERFRAAVDRDDVEQASHCEAEAATGPLGRARWALSLSSVRDSGGISLA